MVPTPLVVPGPDCFTVSIWTDVPVSGFVLHKYIFIVVIPLCCLVYTFMSIWMSMRKCFRAIPPFLVFLWSNISLPKTETSRSPFPGFDFFDQKWSPSAPFLSLPVRFGGHLRNIVFFSDFSLKSLRHWSVILQYFSLCSSMVQLSAYGEADKFQTNPAKESGTVKVPSTDSSIAPDLPQDRHAGPPSSGPADSARSISSNRDLPP